MGGAIVVIADSPERAMELAVKDEESGGWPCHWVIGKEDEEGNEVWHLVEQFDTTETKERVALINTNEA